MEIVTLIGKPAFAGKNLMVTLSAFVPNGSLTMSSCPLF